MSDEFLKVATAEINNEISEIKNILDSCTNNLDVCANATKIQKSTHKIKGLAPMMGKTDLGSLAALLDTVLKKITNNTVPDTMFESITVAVDEMKNSMNNPNHSLGEITQRISKISLMFH